MSDITATEYRKRFRQAVKDGKVKGRVTEHIARDYDIPVGMVSFWRMKPSYINYDDPLHKAAASARTRMRKVAKRWPEAGEPLTVTEIRDTFRGVTLCELCGTLLGNNVSIDHSTPIARGGANAVGNLLAVHGRCNQIKGKLDYGEYMELRRLLFRLGFNARTDIEARLIAGGARRYK